MLIVPVSCEIVRGSASPPAPTTPSITTAALARAPTLTTATCARITIARLLLPFGAQRRAAVGTVECAMTHMVAHHQ